jgi:flagellar basal body P-ring formation protein FlgA
MWRGPEIGSAKAMPVLNFADFGRFCRGGQSVSGKILPLTGKNLPLRAGWHGSCWTWGLPCSRLIKMTKFRHLLLIAVAVPPAVWAQSFQSHAAIDAAVAASLTGTGLAAWPVDRRLKLSPCPEALNVGPPVSGLVAVHCVSLRWRVHARIDGPPATVTLAPILIKRGDPVQVELVASGFALSYSGLAESDARLGERVRVRVDQKAAPIIGEVIGAGAVRINGLN